MTKPLDGKVAIVTGVSSPVGIGAAVARRLAGSGARLLVAADASPDSVAKECADLLGDPKAVLPLTVDLGDSASVTAMVAEAEKRFGRVDLLVNNAAVRINRRFGEFSATEFDRAVAVNLRAPFLLAQRVLPGMRGRAWGRILFVSSVAAFTGGIVGPHYAASKSGLHGLTHFLAARVARDGVTVNAIAPALVEDTGMLPGSPEELRSRVPVGRLGRPDEVAELAVAMLANGYLTSQVVGLDGGMYPR